MALFHTTVVDNQIKALDTIGTAQGSIATFDTDRAERLVSCVCEVASGSSEITILSCGKNIFDSSTITAGSRLDPINGGVLGSSASYISDYIPVKPTDIKILFDYTSLDSPNARAWCFYDSNKGFISSIVFDITNRNQTVTIPNGTAFIRCTFDNGNTAIIITFDLTATTYEPYNGTLYSVSFGETLSDTATYDAISGVLTRNDSTTKQLDSCNIVALDNELNHVYNNCGDTSLSYQLTVGKAIS